MNTAPIAVIPCHAKHGTVFYVADPMARDTVTFTSQAPLEDIVGSTNAITGYVVYDPGHPTMGVRGSFTVPTTSLDTGIPLRDEHLRSPMWLDAASHPHITFTVEETEDAIVVKHTDAFQTYNMTLVGSFSLHGRTRRMKIPARVTFLKESPQTRQKKPGNLLAIRAGFNVRLRDFNITGPQGMDLIGSKVGDTISVEVSLFASDQKPMAANPCNPCGGKAANPCNPCGGKAKNPCNPCGGRKPANPCNPRHRW